MVGGGRHGKRWLAELRAQRREVRCVVDTHPSRIGQRLGEVPVIAYDALPAQGPCFVLLAIGTQAGRDDARMRLGAMGLREQADFLCVQ